MGKILDVIDFLGIIKVKGSKNEKTFGHE